MTRWWCLLLGPLLGLPASAQTEEFSFDISSYEKKRFEWFGFLELTAGHLELDEDSAFYNLSFPGDDGPSSFQRYQGAGELGALYRFKKSSLHFRGRAEIGNDYFGTQDDGRVQELYYAIRPSDRLSAGIGKRVIKWGKGYAWNPVGFVERPKDPNDPELTREGFTLGTVDYVRSFGGALKTVAVTSVLLPVTDDLNRDFSPKEDVNLAGKVYLLYRDTDIDVMFLASGSRSGRLGADFSRNLTSNFELHGELAYINDERKLSIDSSNRLVIVETDAVNGLLGLRYLTPSEVVWIIEYYRNGSGYDAGELERFFRLAKSDPLASSDLLDLAQRARQSGFGAPNPGKNYLYVRTIKKEPFDVVYSTVALTTIVNLEDQSFSITPELIYTGVKNTEARLRLVWLNGSENTEFGEKLSDWRVELRLRYFF